MISVCPLSSKPSGRWKISSSCPTKRSRSRSRPHARRLGPRVVILGHHYQRDDVIRHADLTGDSYQLSVMASQTDAEYIVFCGVHFMAESADILGKPSQRVILPDLGAGCSMADMATIDQVEDAWEQLRDIGVLEQQVAPITYMNSSAAIKAFCGRNEGVVCTSSNAVPLFDIYLKEFDKMFFFPGPASWSKHRCEVRDSARQDGALESARRAGRKYRGTTTRCEADPLAGALLGARPVQAVARR